MRVGGKYLIFRTSWIYGPHGHNFLLTMLRLASERDKLSVVDDQYGAPTTSIEVANATKFIVDGVLAGDFGTADEWSGLFHLTCAGSTSWYGFAQTIFDQAAKIPNQKIPIVVPIASRQYPTPARRPCNSVLSNEKLNRRFLIKLPDWEVGLESVIRALVIQKAESRLGES